MKNSIFFKYVVPFFQWYLLLIGATIAIDYFFHRYHLEIIGRYMGFVGTITILVSFIYSLRKRQIIKTGAPKQMLQLHEYLSWSGAVMIMVHAGIHFNAVLPWLALFMLLISVATGRIGKFILKKANETLKEKKQELIKNGISSTEAEDKLFYDSIFVDMMKKWRSVHLPITLILALLSLTHIITIVMYSK